MGCILNRMQGIDEILYSTERCIPIGMKKPLHVNNFTRLIIQPVINNSDVELISGWCSMFVAEWGIRCGIRLAVYATASFSW